MFSIHFAAPIVGGGAVFGQEEGDAHGLEGRSLPPGFHGRGSRTAVPSTLSSAGRSSPPPRSWRIQYQGHLRYFTIPWPGIRLQWCRLPLSLAPPRSPCLLTSTSSSRGFWPISPLLLLCHVPSPQLLLWWRTLTLLYLFPSLVRHLSRTGWIRPLSQTPPPSEEELEQEVLPESWAPVPPDWQVSQVAGSAVLLHRDGASQGEAAPVPGQEVCWGTSCHSPLPS
ncbi:hypothetical protein E2C01_048153 [Portunus trituberculatus]|uniref:Uncharacterized protein n=1 Tax=Portunus trituberculatus TaxID=210409 RepID=A0A5B7G5N0_PORTR|nr:hypothetical protein [Portunus trituberculatus]